MPNYSDSGWPGVIAVWLALSSFMTFLTYGYFGSGVSVRGYVVWLVIVAAVLIASAWERSSR